MADVAGLVIVGDQYVCGHYGNMIPCRFADQYLIVIEMTALASNKMMMSFLKFYFFRHCRVIYSRGVCYLNLR